MVRADADALYPILSDPSLYVFTVDSPPPSAAALSEVLARREGRRSPAGDEVWLNWVIRERAEGVAIGYVQATMSPLHTYVAWVVGTVWQRHGYASEAAAALVAWLERLGAPAVRACVHPRHVASQKVAHRAGLRLTSEAREGEDVWAVP